MPHILVQLARTIEARKGADKTQSYVAELFAKGPEKCAEKFGEEAIEAIIAAVKNDPENLTQEAADVIFHLLVMLSARGIQIEDVLGELERRAGTSGHVEKASRIN